MTTRPIEFTAKTAAAMLGLTMSALRKLRERGKITGRKIGRDWFYSPVDLEPHMKPAIGTKGGKLGRPRKRGPL